MPAYAADRAEPEAAAQRACSCAADWRNPRIQTGCAGRLEFFPPQLRGPILAPRLRIDLTVQHCRAESAYSVHHVTGATMGIETCGNRHPRRMRSDLPLAVVAACVALAVAQLAR